MRLTCAAANRSGTGAFVTVWWLAGFYFQFNDDTAVPWIENHGIGLGVFSAASGIACIYFFCAACVVAVRRALHAKTKTNVAEPRQCSEHAPWSRRL